MDNSFWVNYGEYIVGIPALIISTALAVWIFIKQKNKKKFTYNVSTDVTLLAYHEAIEDKIEVYYNKVRVNRIAIQIIEFENSGKIPILKSDFDSNIKIVFDTDVFIFDAVVLNKKPDDLDILIEYERNEIEIRPLLLNEKDIFSIKILSNKSRASFSILGRIIGLKSFEKASDNLKAHVSALIAMLAFFIFSGTANYLINIIGITSVRIIFSIVIVAFFYFTINSIIHLRKRKRFR